MNVKDFLFDWNRKKWEEKNKFMYSEEKATNQWPWFNDHLDPDILAFLKSHGVSEGRLLDLGTCSGSQAIELAQQGFDVVGSDISETALEKAIACAERLPSSVKIKFLYDDILQSKLDEKQFDFVLDRGCFHSICCFGGIDYIKNVSRILKDDGKIILKTMSSKEDRFIEYNHIGKQKIPMPYHFTEAQLREVFEDHFNVEQVKDSYFYSAVVNPPARAYLTILSQKGQKL